jgi:hypothetical protein
VLVVILIAAIAVLAAVVLAAMGRGGGLSVERNDYVPLDLGPVTATDVALLRPPTGLWGYNMQATDDAMDQIAESIRERDVRIVALEQLVTDLGRDETPMQLLGSPYVGARHRRSPLDPAEPQLNQGDTPFAQGDTPFAQADTPFNPAETRMDPEPDPFRAHRDAPATEPARFPFDPPRPSGDFLGPPERSHD